MSEGEFGGRRFYRADRDALKRFAYILWTMAALIPILTIVLLFTQFNPLPVELVVASIAVGTIFFIPGYSLIRIAGSYIETYPDGLEYHLRGNVSTAKWSEVVRVGMVPLNERQPEGIAGEGLIIRSLKRPAIRASVQPDDGMYLWYIPLQPFGWHWKETGLGKEIAQYAPHLLNAQAEQQTKRTYMQEYQ